MSTDTRCPCTYIYVCPCSNLHQPSHVGERPAQQHNTMKHKEHMKHMKHMIHRKHMNILNNQHNRNSMNNHGTTCYERFYRFWSEPRLQVFFGKISLADLYVFTELLDLGENLDFGRSWWHSIGWGEKHWLTVVFSSNLFGLIRILKAFDNSWWIPCAEPYVFK